MFSKETKILVVDDMSTMRKLVCKQLKDLGFTNVMAVDDGSTAWPVIEKAVRSKEPFELVIADWNMPRMNGLELLNRIRSTSGLIDTPFIMLTAESENHQVDKANQLKVSGYIKKPFTPDMLLSTIEQVSKTCKKVA